MTFYNRRGSVEDYGIISTEELLSRYRKGERNFSGTRFHQVRVAQETLSECDFSNSIFDDCILAVADMRGCNFKGCKIDKTNAIRVRLEGSDLTNAHISGAFGEADFFGANLTGASIWANVHDSFFLNANFSHTQFMAAIFRAALFGNNVYDETLFFMCDLSEVQLQLPSHIDMGTVLKTAALNRVGLQAAERKTAENSQEEEAQKLLAIGASTTRDFFRANGVHDSDLKKIYGDSVSDWSPYQSTFISYASADEEFVHLLRTYLQGGGVQVWFAPHDMQGGRTIIDQITKAIGEAERLILVLSENSMQSRWVATEILEARHAEKTRDIHKLFPIRLVDMESIRRWQLFDSDSGEDLARVVRQYHIPDFSSWKDPLQMGKSAMSLLRDLKSS